MKKIELKEKLHELGLNNRKLASMVGISEQSVAMWGSDAAGGNPVPPWLPSYLEYYADAKKYWHIQSLLSDISRAGN